MNASSTLTKLIQSHRWEEVLSKCKTVSSEEYLEQNPRSNRTPLHMACSMRGNQIPISVIEALLSHSDRDKAMRMKDKQNDYLPLHCAIRYKASLATISLLVQNASPQLVQDLRDQSEGGSLSLLNLAVRRRTKCSIIKKLLQLHPEAVNHVSNANWTPLHEAIWHGASIETTKLLVESYPKALLTETVTSRQTPLKLYWSHYSSSLSKEMISLLLKATSTVLFDEAASFPGMIHACLEYFKHQYYIPGLLEYLLDNYPEDTCCSLCDGKLPLHVVSQQRNSLRICNMEALKKIFQGNPSAIRHRDNTHMTPYLLAVLNSNLDVAYELLRLAPEQLLRSA